MKARGCDYVCLTGYERLLGTKGRNEALVLSIQLLVAMILGPRISDRVHGCHPRPQRPVPWARCASDF